MTIITYTRLVLLPQPSSTIISTYPILSLLITSHLAFSFRLMDTYFHICIRWWRPHTKTICHKHDHLSRPWSGHIYRREPEDTPRRLPGRRYRSPGCHMFCTHPHRLQLLQLGWSSDCDLETRCKIHVTTAENSHDGHSQDHQAHASERREPGGVLYKQQGYVLVTITPIDWLQLCMDP